MSSQRHPNGQPRIPTLLTTLLGLVLGVTAFQVISMLRGSRLSRTSRSVTKGRINAYEIWNEPQLADFMYPWDTKNRNLLAQMTKDAIRIIKGNDESALCGAASVLPRG